MFDGSAFWEEEVPVMRSQKIKNKAPRPFKSQFSDHAWAGGNKKTFLPPKKPAAKTGTTSPAATPPDEPEAPASDASV